MRVWGIITFLLLLYTGNICADLSIRYDAIQSGRHLPYHSVMIKNDLVRINQAQGKAPAILINTVSGDIVQLDTTTQRYFRINAATIDQYIHFYKVNRTLLQGLIDQGMTQFNPQQREQIMSILDQYKNSTAQNQFNFRVSNKSAEILGIKCRVISIFQNQQIISEVCMSDLEQLGLSVDDIKSVNLLKGFIRQYRQSAPRQHQQLFSLLDQAAPQLNGIPMQIVNFRPDGKINNVIQTGSISLRKIPEQMYNIPPNFQPNSYPLL